MATNTRTLVTNTRILFSALLRSAGVDCVCDIGSRDGMDALRFRQIFPKARILACEANKINHAKMTANTRLAEGRVEILPFAISNTDGEATFTITAVSANDPDEISGTSSLLGSGSVEVKEVVRVPTRRIDSLISERCAECRSVGLWVDVEGAEYLVFEGMTNICDRVGVIHVELAVRPMREGQRTMSEVTALLDRLGFDLVDRGFLDADLWGDAVYVNRAVRAKMGWAYGFSKLKARLSARLHVDVLAVFLYKRMPWLHRIAYRLYHQLGTANAKQAASK